MRKEGIGVSPAGPCPWRNCTRGVFPVWSLSTTLLTKACIDYLGPLSPSDACGQRGCSSTTLHFYTPCTNCMPEALPTQATVYPNTQPCHPLLRLSSMTSLGSPCHVNAATFQLSIKNKTKQTAHFSNLSSAPPSLSRGNHSLTIGLI